jgi:hypothetical protein
MVKGSVAIRAKAIYFSGWTKMTWAVVGTGREHLFDWQLLWLLWLRCVISIMWVFSKLSFHCFQSFILILEIWVTFHKSWQLFVFGQKCGNAGNRVYMFESMWQVRVNVTIRGGMCTRATGRRQANYMHFESWFYCFTVAYRVNMEQRV